MEAYFKIPLPPCGKERPRFNRNTGRTYTPQKTRSAERTIQEAYKAACGNVKFSKSVPLYMTITLVYPVNASDSAAQKNRKLAGEEVPTKKPDWDNAGKLVCDALNKVAYYDDAQIVSATVAKRYGKTPCMAVFITDHI